jgi:exodeoxyribonuclease VIII
MIFTGLKSADNLAENEYHADTSRVSASMIKTCWAKTPAHVYAQYFDPDRELVKKESFTFGAMFHAAILEKSEFDNRFVIIPEGIDRRTKDGKALWADIEASGKSAIKQADWEKSQAMAGNLISHPVFAEHRLQSARKEIAIIGDGVRCKPDLLFVYGTRAVCIDLKTCVDASPRAFERSAFNYGYHIQAAWYSDMVAELYGVPCEFLFACVEKTAPYLPMVYRASESMIESGRNAYLENLDVIRNCMVIGEWPGYSEEVEELNLPEWAQQSEVDESITFGDE